MLSDEFDGDFLGGADDSRGGGDRSGAGAGPVVVTARIVRTEEQMGVMMQRVTMYVIEVSDFGRCQEVPHRYSDFETLHRSLLTDCPMLRLPPLPPKGVDGSDAAVVASRKVELEKLLKVMLRTPEVLGEKQLHLWKFLNLGTPAVIASRFVLISNSRSTTSKTLAKLIEPKYKDDVYRLGHNAVVDLLSDAARELRSGGEAEAGGNGGGSQWARQTGGRTALCQLLSGALGSSETARARLLEADLVANLLGIVERDVNALDDTRLALNVVVAKEADRLSTIVAAFIRRGGLSQLAVLAQQPKCQEFVAKLLWLSWDAPVRSPFAQPRGPGLGLLQALMRSQAPTSSLLGAVLLAGMVANGDFDSEPAHRGEALKKVTALLGAAEASMDPQFAKTLCGANSTIVRLAGMLDDRDLAPIILGLLCAAKPAPAKLGRITGNLAAIVGDKTGAHAEETRARAAELLLHVQSSPGASMQPTSSAAPSQARMSTSNSDGAGYPSSTSNTLSGSTAARSSPLHSGGGGGAGGGPAADLERCEGIAAHEESLDNALRTQLEEAVSKTRQSLEVRAEAVRRGAELARRRLQPLPECDFRGFERSFASFRSARESWEKVVRDGEFLHRDLERQLEELRTARPSSVDPHTYKERLLSAERIYADVKMQRESLTSADSAAREATQRAERSSSEYRRATDELKRLEDEISNFRVQRSAKETEATKLRHKANTPSLDAMKRQAAESIERNLAQARELQVVGQRVQQGDPDYLRDGETRDGKISELTQKLATLKKQHQQLLQQQKDLDFDPVALNDQAAKLEDEAMELGRSAEAAELRRLEAERSRSESVNTSSRDSQEARVAQEQRDTLARQVASTEAEARRQMNLLQPMIQEQHSGWQNLLSRQKKLDADQARLGNQLDQSERSSEAEAHTRAALSEQVEGLIERLLGVRAFLQEVDAVRAPDGVSAPLPGAGPAGVASSAGAGGARSNADPFADDSDPFGLPLAKPAPAAAPAPAAVAEEPLPLAAAPPAPAPAAAQHMGLDDDDGDYDDFPSHRPPPPASAAVAAPELFGESSPSSGGPGAGGAGGGFGGGGFGAVEDEFSLSAPPAAHEAPASALAHHEHFEAAPPLAAAAEVAPAMAPAASGAPALDEEDDFDAFLREGPSAVVGGGAGAAAAEPQQPADPDEL